MRKKTVNTKKMIELPPPWCAAICRNAMNEVCLNDCALKRDTSQFELRDLTLYQMPKFPETGEMTREEKFTSVTVYLSKVVETLQGGGLDAAPVSFRRRNIDSARSSEILKAIQEHRLLSLHQAQDTRSTDREEPKDQEV